MDPQDVPDFFKNEIRLDCTPPIEDENNPQSFPRLEKNFEQVLKFAAGEEEVEDKAKSIY